MYGGLQQSDASVGKMRVQLLLVKNKSCLIRKGLGNENKYNMNNEDSEAELDMKINRDLGS